MATYYKSIVQPSPWNRNNFVARKRSQPSPDHKVKLSQPKFHIDTDLIMMWKRSTNAVELRKQRLSTNQSECWPWRDDQKTPITVQLLDQQCSMQHKPATRGLPWRRIITQFKHKPDVKAESPNQNTPTKRCQTSRTKFDYYDHTRAKTFVDIIQAVIEPLEDDNRLIKNKYYSNNYETETWGIKN